MNITKEQFDKVYFAAEEVCALLEKYHLKRAHRRQADTAISNFRRAVIATAPKKQTTK